MRYSDLHTKAGNVCPLQRATASSGLDPQRWCTGLSSCRGDAGLSAVSVCPSILPVPISAAEQGVSGTINLSVLTFPYFHASGFLRCDQSAWVSVPLWCCKVKVRASAACSTDFSAEWCQRMEQGGLSVWADVCQWKRIWTNDTA